MSCRHNRRSGRVSCTWHWRFRKYECLCEDGAMSNQRSQQTKTDHHADSHIAWLWLWSNSVRHLMMRTYCFSRHPYNSFDRRIHGSCPSVIKHTPISSHDVYLVPGRTNASNIQRCQEDISPCCATTCLSHMPMGQCDTSARLYGISKNVPLKRLSADDTFMQNAWNLWGMTVETTTTAGGQLSWRWPWWDVSITWDTAASRGKYTLTKQPSWQAVYNPQVILQNITRSLPAYYQIRQYGYR